MWTANSFDKSQMLGKIEGRKRRGRQTRRLDGITDAMTMNLGKLQEMVRDRETCHAAVHGGHKESNTTGRLNNDRRLETSAPISQCVLSHSVMFHSVTPWTVTHQIPLSMGFSWQHYWSGLPFPPTGCLPDLGWNRISWVTCRLILTTEPPGKHPPASLSKYRNLLSH